MPDGRLLAIYLNDHLAGATLGVELTKRALKRNRGNELGAFLQGLLREIEEDKRSLERVIESLGIKKSVVKPPAAVVAERLGRLKLNGQVTGYSPLSRVLELEGLTMGVRAKLSLWRNLREAADVAARVPGVDLESLIARAETQLADLDEQRAAAARTAFAAQGGASSPAG
jgi:hypothetical protein